MKRLLPGPVRRFFTRPRTAAVSVGLLLLMAPGVAWAAPTSQTGEVRADQVWVYACAALVFLMQAGFLCLEVGCVRPKAATITALKNVIDWAVCASTFYFIGWGLMFGSDYHGWIGTNFFGLPDAKAAGGHAVGIWAHFVFQLAFAGTAATIVSGALAERTSFFSYLVFSAVITTIIYPVAGHWAWGHSFFGKDNKGWLAELGFIDFAGSTQVHSIGGWAALMGIWIVGPRLGRYGKDGQAREWDTTGLHWTAMGVLILWFSWWGFNGGSDLGLTDRVGPIIVNTNISATFGGIGAMLYSKFLRGGRGISGSFLNGILAGLVGVTASCHMIDPVSAALIGLTSGAISCGAAELLLRMKLDDPVGAAPVHLFCGVWGTLCVALFGFEKEIVASGAGSRLKQLGVQGLGILAIGAFTVAVSFVTFAILKRWVGLRVSPEEEQFGYDIAGVIEPRTQQDVPGEEELRRLLTMEQK